MTADHLVVIGRGRLLADMATELFVESNARKDVLVRSPRAGELAALLAAHGAVALPEGDGGLGVTGMGAPEIADLAAAQRLPVHELAPARLARAGLSGPDRRQCRVPGRNRDAGRRAGRGRAMTASQLRTTPAAVPPAVVRARDLIGSEWTKVRSVRANLWTLLVAALVTIGLTVVVAHSIAAAPAPGSGGPFTPLIASFLGYAEYTVLPVSILGVLTFTSEYSTGLIRTTLVAVPRRWALLAAKAAAAGAAALAAGEVLAFALFFLTQGLLTGRGGLSITHPGVPGAVVAAGFLLPACVLTGLGLGAIARHTAAAIAATVGVIYLLAALCLLLPSPWKEDIGRFTLPFAAYQVVSLHPQPHLFGPAASAAVLIAWRAVILVAAGIVISRRDV